MAILTREAILKAKDMKTESVQVPEWGGEVIVSTMSGTARDRMEGEIWADTKGAESPLSKVQNIRARIVAACAVDKNGNLLFDRPEDAVELGKKNGKALDRVFAVASRLNGIGKADIEEMEKNLGAAHSENSASN